MREFINLVERATLSGKSKYVGKSGRVFYIQHRLDGDMVQCSATVAAISPLEALRRRVAVASCVMVDPTNGVRNNVRVFSAKSHVDPEFQREGLLSAMYDHLENYGLVVYPADGSVGEKYLQSQSADAKAFWAKRQSNHVPKKLEPVTDAEVNGWGEFNIFANATHIGSMPVIETDPLKGKGYHNPLLVLWEKTYAKFSVKLGVTFVENGYKQMIMVSTADNSAESFPHVRNGMVSLSSYDTWLKKFMTPTIEKICIKIDAELNTL